MTSFDLLRLDTKIQHALAGLRNQQMGPRREQIARQQKEVKTKKVIRLLSNPLTPLLSILTYSLFVLFCHRQQRRNMGGAHWTLSRMRAIVVTLPLLKDQNRRLLPFPGSSEDSKTVTGGSCHEFRQVEPDLMCWCGFSI